MASHQPHNNVTLNEMTLFKDLLYNIDSGINKILMQQPPQTSCLLLVHAFTHSCHQTILVLLFFIKSCMSVLHGQTLPLNHLGKGVLGNVVPHFCPVMQRRLQNQVLIGDADFTIDRTSIYKFVFIFLPVFTHKMAYLIVVYFPCN